MARTTSTAKNKPGRDAYDDFLDMIEAKEDGGGSRKKTAQATGASAARKKSAQPGGTSEKRSSAKPAGKDASRRAKPETAPAAPEKKREKRPEDAGSVRKKPPAAQTDAKRASGSKAPKQADGAGKAQSLKQADAAGKAKSAKQADGARKAAGTKQEDGAGKARSPKQADGVRKQTSSQGKKVGTAPKQAASGAKKTASGKSASAKGGAPARRRQPVLHVDNADGRDPYDDYLDNAVPAKRKKQRRGGGVTAFLLAAILCIVGLGAFQEMRYRSFASMKDVVERETFYEGTSVEGVDLSQMTLQQALDYWAQQIEPKYAQRTVSIGDEAVLTAQQLGYSSDYQTVLVNAWNAGRSGTLEERYEQVTGRQSKPVSYTVARKAYSEAGIAACVSAMAEQINTPARDAHIESFDAENYTFVFAEEQPGRALDTEALARDIMHAMDAGGGTVEPVVHALEPSLKKADIEPLYGLIDSAITNASSSSSNRLTNIRLALKHINGTCLAPGETFSFNGVVGKRTSERGFKVATAYSGGEVTEEVGGGICQVSTTLFNAAVKADLEIVERHNHSLTVSYVDKGKDASVNWNSQDLRFTNTTDDNIYICCYLTDDKRIRVGIFGRKLPDGEYITVEGVTTDTIDFETVYQMSFELAPGEARIAQEGKNGYTASAYKLRWDKDGNRISRELLCKSRYKAVSRIVEHGPE